jgi:hypothetical protein
LCAAFVEGLAPLQGAIALDQHFFQAGQIEAAQTIAQDVIAEAAITADPVLQVGLGQIRLHGWKLGSRKTKLWKAPFTPFASAGGLAATTRD